MSEWERNSRPIDSHWDHEHDIDGFPSVEQLTELEKAYPGVLLCWHDMLTEEREEK